MPVNQTEKKQANTDNAFKYLEKYKEVNDDLISQYLYVYQRNQYQGTSKVKTRSEVSGGGAKPWKQKGTGRARVGSNRSPIWVGGGVIHGPIPGKSYKKLNREMEKAALGRILYLRSSYGQIKFFDFGESGKKSISTKNAQKVIEGAGRFKNVLVIHKNDNVIFKSFRNIRNTKVSEASGVNVFELAKADEVFIEKGAVEIIKQRLN